MRGASKSSTVEDLSETGEERAPGLPLATVVVKRRKLELARTDVMHQLELARADAHREMLQRALQALEQELERLI
jgi:hypothetical protein